MINTTDAFRTAVSADTRRTRIRVETDVVDPDLEYQGIDVPPESPVSVKEQSYKTNDKLTNYATLEQCFWVLDGTRDIFKADFSRQSIHDKIGFVSSEKSGANGDFQSTKTICLNVEYKGLLQNITVYFPDDPAYGVPKNFDVEIWSGEVLSANWEVRNNTESEPESPEVLEVYNPTKIILKIYSWTLPDRRIRLRRLMPGFHLVWTENDIASLSIQFNSDPSCSSLPYSTAKLSIDNSAKTFEPRNKEGYFKSIQARQKVEFFIGIDCDGACEYKRTGVFYQQAGGWSTSDNGLSIDWSLVDIIGLLTDREFSRSFKGLETFSDWAGAVVSLLGRNFADNYAIDSDYIDKTITVYNQDKKLFSDMHCGDLIRFLALATGTWPRADQETGYLTFEPLWDQGTRITLNNMSEYPTMSENEDISSIKVNLYGVEHDESDEDTEEEALFGGTNMAASRSVTIDSPFTKDEADASDIFRWIVTQFGGNSYDITWRGDPSVEVGDVVTLELSKDNVSSARVIENSLDFSSGVLAGCKTTLAQPIGFETYANTVVLTEDCTWVVPDEIRAIFVIIVGGGQAGEDGDNGTESRAGTDGLDGKGGKVFADHINVYPGQNIAVTIGKGTRNYWGEIPTASTFGYLTSENGGYYKPSYTDISGGYALARTGAADARLNSGDGGKGGLGGRQGKGHTVKDKDDFGMVTERTVWDVVPGLGEKGVMGADGCVIIHYNDP